MKKILFNIIFIIISTTLIVVLSENGILKKHIAFSIIPILIAYFFGQYTEKNLKT